MNDTYQSPQKSSLAPPRKFYSSLKIRALTRRYGLAVVVSLGLVYLGLFLPTVAHADKPTTTTVTLSEKHSLEFKTVAGSADGPSTIILSPTGAITTTGYGIVIRDRFDVGKYSVRGPHNATVLITLPNTVTLTNGASQATLSNFTSSPSGVGTLNHRGKLTIKVGATLTIPAGQAGGDYSGPMTIFVDLQ